MARNIYIYIHIMYNNKLYIYIYIYIYICINRCTYIIITYFLFLSMALTENVYLIMMMAKVMAPMSAHISNARSRSFSTDAKISALAMPPRVETGKAGTAVQDVLEVVVLGAWGIRIF